MELSTEAGGQVVASTTTTTTGLGTREQLQWLLRTIFMSHSVDDDRVQLEAFSHYTHITHQPS